MPINYFKLIRKAPESLINSSTRRDWSAYNWSEPDAALLKDQCQQLLMFIQNGAIKDKLRDDADNIAVTVDDWQRALNDQELQLDELAKGKPEYAQSVTNAKLHLKRIIHLICNDQTITITEKIQRLNFLYSPLSLCATGAILAIDRVYSALTANDLYAKLVDFAKHVTDNIAVQHRNDVHFINNIRFMASSVIPLIGNHEADPFGASEPSPFDVDVGYWVNKKYRIEPFLEYIYDELLAAFSTFQFTITKDWQSFIDANVKILDLVKFLDINKSEIKYLLLGDKQNLAEWYKLKEALFVGNGTSFSYIMLEDNDVHRLTEELALQDHLYIYTANDELCLRMSIPAIPGQASEQLKLKIGSKKILEYINNCRIPTLIDSLKAIFLQKNRAPSLFQLNQAFIRYKIINKLHTMQLLINQHDMVATPAELNLDERITCRMYLHADGAEIFFIDNDGNYAGSIPTQPPMVNNKIISHKDLMSAIKKNFQEDYVYIYIHSLMLVLRFTNNQSDEPRRVIEVLTLLCEKNIKGISTLGMSNGMNLSYVLNDMQVICDYGKGLTAMLPVAVQLMIDIEGRKLLFANNYALLKMISEKTLNVQAVVYGSIAMILARINPEIFAKEEFWLTKMLHADTVNAVCMQIPLEKYTLPLWFAQNGLLSVLRFNNYRIAKMISSATLNTPAADEHSLFSCLLQKGGLDILLEMEKNTPSIISETAFKTNIKFGKFDGASPAYVISLFREGQDLLALNNFRLANMISEEIFNMGHPQQASAYMGSTYMWHALYNTQAGKNILAAKDGRLIKMISAEALNYKLNPRTYSLAAYIFNAPASEWIDFLCMQDYRLGRMLTEDTLNDQIPGDDTGKTVAYCIAQDKIALPILALDDYKQARYISAPTLNKHRSKGLKKGETLALILANSAPGLAILAAHQNHLAKMINKRTLYKVVAKGTYAGSSVASSLAATAQGAAILRAIDGTQPAQTSNNTSGADSEQPPEKRLKMS